MPSLSSHPSTRRLAALALGLASAISLASARQVTVSNTVPRRDTDGAILDAHDGKILVFKGAQPPGGVQPSGGASFVGYYFAASYGNCTEPAGNSGCSGAAPGACGFQLNHNVSLYTTTDFVTWVDQGHVYRIQDSPVLQGNVLFCPKVLYNAKTQLWVMWFNYVQAANFAISKYAVATSKSATGPFQLVVPEVTSLAFADQGDFNLFQDDDGSAYVIYTSHISNYSPSHCMSIEKLTPDYLGSLGNASSSGFFGQSFVEAPAFFKRAGTYYAVFGQCCCYCQGGSPVTVYTAPTPLGPFSTQNNIGAEMANGGGKCANPSDRISRAEALIDALTLQKNEAGKGTTGTCRLRDAISSQQTDIFRYYDSQGNEQFMWVGDRWQSAPDGLKAHDFTFWYPLSFTSDGNVTAMQAVSNFTIDI